MPKIINVTLPDEIHDLLQKIKEREGFSNNAEALEWVIRMAAKKEAS